MADTPALMPSGDGLAIHAKTEAIAHSEPPVYGYQRGHERRKPEQPDGQNVVLCSHLDQLPQGIVAGQDSRAVIACHVSTPASRKGAAIRDPT